MKHDNIPDSAEQVPQETAWQLIDWHAVNTATKQRVYVRELLDIGSYEFEFCKLSKKQRLNIIVSIGEPEIFRVMKEIAVEKRRTEYREENFKMDIALLRKFVNPDLDLGVLLGVSVNNDSGTLVP